MRKIIATLLIAAAVVLSGVSVTTFATGQVTESAWAEGGGC